MSAPLLEVRRLSAWFPAEGATRLAPGSGRGRTSATAPAPEGRHARAVDDVSFRVEEGEAVGIVGESGCGKTITSLALLGLMPSAGRVTPESSILLRGEELVGASERRLRAVRGNEIAMIFQEPMTSLNPVRTIGSQVIEALRLRRGPGVEPMSRSESRLVAADLLREVGLTDPEARLGAYPHQLSGGMRQRVMIAMALSCEPALLVADEPTTALDVTVQAQILDLLTELRRGRRMALPLITHDLGVVAEVCDRVIVMYAGQVVESGRIEEIFSHPRHPYTRGLVDSLPRLDGLRERLRPIEGSLPDPSDLPKGCRFHDRCVYAFERCRLEEPPLFEIGESGFGTASRCWLEMEPEEKGALEAARGHRRRARRGKPGSQAS
jgi:peptide/nickel transport system ATP-binding protein